LEFGKERGGIKIDDGFRKNVSFVIDSFDFHTIFEWFEVEFFKEGSFGGFDFFVLGADLEVLGDLNLTLNDLGRDVQGMEEVDL